MRITSIKNISFKRAYTTKERQEAEKLQQEALKLLDCDKVIAIVPETSFPSDSAKNSGVGQLNSEYSSKFLDFFKSYTGANSIKVLPPGEYQKTSNGFYCNYAATGLTLGTHTINIEELTTESMGNILSKETLKEVYKSAKQNNTTELANFENVVGNKSKQGQALKEAYDNFIKSNSPALSTIKQNFEKYKTDNAHIIEPRALFEVLSEEYNTEDITKWSDTDRNLFNTDFVTIETRNKRINELKNTHHKDIDFVYFKQFLAEQDLKKARKMMNEKGLSLTGDCLVAFSRDEIWAHPTAFEKANICSKDWSLTSLNYSNILDNNSESNKLLRLKVEQFAKRYDNIRFDVGWSYVNPILYPYNGQNSDFDKRYCYDKSIDGYRVKEPLNDKLISIIEDSVKKIKGSNYKQENLFYEIEAGVNEFTAFDWDKNEVIKGLKNRTIIQSTMYMDDNYATINFLENKMRVPRKNYIIMSGNHDHLALASLAQGVDPDKILDSGNDIKSILDRQYSPLAKALKLDEQALRKSPEEFTRAKFAYNFLGQNVKMFFMDIFGRTEQFDAQNNNGKNNYRQRISSNYEEEFHKSVQSKKGLNIMDALAKAMKAKGLDKTNKDTYNKLVSFANILYEKGALSEEEANKLSSPKPPLDGQKKKSNKIILIVLGILALTAGLGYYIKNHNNSKKN